MMSIYIYGVIRIVRTHQGGGGGGGGRDLAKAYAPYKKHHFSYTKCVLEEGGGGNLRFCAYVLCECPLSNFILCTNNGPQKTVIGNSNTHETPGYIEAL